MDKRLTLSQQWDKEIRRLLNQINRQSKKGIEFNPLPTKPKKVTKENVDRLRKVKPIQFRKEVNIKTEIPIKQHKDIYDKSHSKTLGGFDYIRKGRIYNHNEKEPLTTEERKKIRIEAGKKAAETYRKSFKSEEDYRKVMRERAQKRKSTKQQDYLPKQANLIYENVMDLIEQTENLVQPVKAGGKGGNVGTRFEIEMGKEFRRLINKSIEKYGMEETAKKLEAKGKELQDFIEDVIYRWYKEDYRSIEGAFKVFAEILGVDVGGNENATLIDAIFEQYGLDEDGNEV